MRHLTACLWLGILPLCAQAQERGKDFYHDFRGRPVTADFAPFGEGVSAMIRVEPEGLRLTVPKDKGPQGPIGLRTTFPVRGDFEITAAFEILHADEPITGFGVGFTLYVPKMRPSLEAATLGRVRRAKGKDRIAWDRSIDVPDKPQRRVGDSVPCTATIGRLRLQRTGTILRYAWAEGIEGGTFQEVHAEDFGADELRTVKLNATTGRQVAAVDVRFIELRIRSQEMLATTPAPAAQTAPPAGPSRLWLWLLLCLAVGFALSGLLVWLRRRSGPTPPS